VQSTHTRAKRRGQQRRKQSTVDLRLPSVIAISTKLVNNLLNQTFTAETWALTTSSFSRFTLSIFSCNKVLSKFAERKPQCKVQLCELKDNVETGNQLEINICLASGIEISTNFIFG